MFDTKWYLLYDYALMQSNKKCFRKLGPRWKIFSVSTSTFWLFTFKRVYDICGHYKGNTLVSHYITRLSIKNSIYIFFITIKHNISWICSSHKWKGYEVISYDFLIFFIFHNFFSHLFLFVCRDAFREFFAANDTDGSGALTADEIRKFASEDSEASVEEILAQCDANSDGKITLEEFLKGIDG